MEFHNRSPETIYARPFDDGPLAGLSYAELSYDPDKYIG